MESLERGIWDISSNQKNRKNKPQKRVFLPIKSPPRNYGSQLLYIYSGGGGGGGGGGGLMLSSITTLGIGYS